MPTQETHCIFPNNRLLLYEHWVDYNISAQKMLPWGKTSVFPARTGLTAVNLLFLIKQASGKDSYILLFLLNFFLAGGGNKQDSYIAMSFTTGFIKNIPNWLSPYPQKVNVSADKIKDLDLVERWHSYRDGQFF